MLLQLLNSIESTIIENNRFPITLPSLSKTLNVQQTKLQSLIESHNDDSLIVRKVNGYYTDVEVKDITTPLTFYSSNSLCYKHKCILHEVIKSDDLDKFLVGGRDRDKVLISKYCTDSVHSTLLKGIDHDSFLPLKIKLKYSAGVNISLNTHGYFTYDKSATDKILDKEEELRRFMSNKLREITASALKRNITVSLSVEDLLTVYNQQDGVCHYSGEQLKPKRRSLEEKGDALSVDRIDSSKHYTLSNIRLCLFKYNAMKSAMGEDDFLTSVKRVYEHLQLDKINLDSRFANRELRLKNFKTTSNLEIHSKTTIFASTPLNKQ